MIKMEGREGQKRKKIILIKKGTKGRFLHNLYYNENEE